METTRTIKMKAGWRTLALFFAMCAALYLAYRGFLAADYKFGTLKGAWIDSLPIEVKRGVMLCFGGLFGLVAASLIPPLLLRVPLVRLDGDGIHRYGLRGRKFIRWNGILSINDSTRDRQKVTWSNSGHHRFSIRPIPSDDDPREMVFPWVLIDINALAEHIHAFRPDLISIPPSMVERRAVEARAARAARRPPHRAPAPATEVDPKKWTG